MQEEFHLSVQSLLPLKQIEVFTKFVEKKLGDRSVRKLVISLQLSLLRQKLKYATASAKENLMTTN